MEGREGRCKGRGRDKDIRARQRGNDRVGGGSGDRGGGRASDGGGDEVVTASKVLKALESKAPEVVERKASRRGGR